MTQALPRRSFRRLGACSAALLTVPLLAVAAGPAAAADVGTVGFSYVGATAPTGQKPQSKLWYAYGSWWGALFGSASTDYHIYKYVWASNSWSDTGVLVDERASSYMDTLFDGTHLYVATAGPTAANTAQSPRIVRYTYNTGTGTWSRDAGYPVTVGNGGVEAIVLDKDSTGRLWATFTKGNKVMLTHSTTADNVWKTPYPLPTPAGQANVDPDDISSIVAYDGNKIGVMWSNQLDGSIYWASHNDGAGDMAWTTTTAYQRPQGADDHINLKSLQSDAAGRVFAAVKTSLSAPSDPLVNLLILKPGGGWTIRVFGTVADDHTRAIVQIDTGNRKIYMFADSPCCNGGNIYYKVANLDNPVFPAGKGTPFMVSAANPKINNPTTSKSTVSSTTGLLVLAGDDTTFNYVYSRLSLAASVPDTTIVSGPAGPQPSGAPAAFDFTSSNAGSTFECALDGAAFAACTTPKTYTGLAAGSHTFAVRAVGAAGTDPTPATRTWTVVSGTTAFSDDFASGSFTAGGWARAVSGDGTAAVIATAGTARTPGAKLTATHTVDSAAYARKTLSATVANAWYSASLRMSGSDPAGDTLALVKLYDSGGTRLVTVNRLSGTGALNVDIAGVVSSTTGKVGLNAWATLTVHVIPAGAGASTVEVILNGTSVFKTTTATLGTFGVRSLQIGTDNKRVQYTEVVDNVRVWQ